MSRVFMKGCEAIAEAAVRAGCRFFAGYPITPQNEIPEYFSRRMPEVGGVFVQGESEVASVNMVYGAASAGVRAMTSSSSPGIALKSEGISYCAAALYESWKKDVQVEEYRLEDAEVVLTAYGISARICKSAVELLRAQGVKAGLIRPITVHPVPYAAYDHIDYSKVKAVLDVEMSIPAQFVDDVAVAVKDRCLIETCLCSGGNIMSRDKVLAAVKKIMEGK